MSAAVFIIVLVVTMLVDRTIVILRRHASLARLVPDQEQTRSHLQAARVKRATDKEYNSAAGLAAHF